MSKLELYDPVIVPFYVNSIVEGHYIQARYRPSPVSRLETISHPAVFKDVREALKMGQIIRNDLENVNLANWRPYKLAGGQMSEGQAPFSPLYQHAV